MFATVPIDGLFYIGLVSIITSTFLLGYIIARKTSGFTKGFYTLLATSLGLFFWLLLWFQEASRSIFMGTLPWMINQFFGVVMYIIFLTVSYFILKQLHRSTS